MPFVNDFFSKLFVIWQVAREEDLTTSELWTLVRPGMILNLIFLDTCYLQALYSSNGKSFMVKIEKPLEIS